MKNEEMIEKWEKFWDSDGQTPFFQEFNFEAIALGFFIALGASVDQARNLYQICISRGKF